MSKNTDSLPFTEIVERAAELSRETDETRRSRIRGTVNDVNSREVAREADWRFLITTSAIVTIDDTKM